MKKGHDRVTFKAYNMNQPALLPASLDELVPKEHLVRVVNQTIEELSIEPLLKRYKGGGTSSFHPKMMLKVMVYAYTQKTFTSRKIAKALRENIQFMWISGGNKPDFRTINRFRGSVMKEVVGEVFTSVIEYLLEKKYVRLENYFADGTKIESSANKYQWVWAKSTTNYKKQLQEKIKGLLEEIDRDNEEEEEEYGDDDLEEMGGGNDDMDGKQLKEVIEKLNQRLKEKPEDKKLAKAIKTLEKDYLPREEKYEEQEKILAGRKSYAKTDHDATFMRMKEDHMRNGQLKPGYNVQMGTENQFIVGFSIHQRPGDTACLIPHLEEMKRQLGTLPNRMIADAGYGSEENYTYVEKEKLENYVKFNLFHKEQKRSWRKQRFRVENWKYEKECDEYICPENQKLSFLREFNKKTEMGSLSKIREYECHNCGECPIKSECTRAAGNRRVQVNFRLNQYRDQARTNLLSDQGRKLSIQRNVDVESVFGQLKHNWGFRRFLLKGKEKVRTGWGSLCIAHNIAKLAVQ
jgi:transposase